MDIVIRSWKGTIFVRNLVRIQLLEKRSERGGFGQLPGPPHTEKPESKDEEEGEDEKGGVHVCEEEWLGVSIVRKYGL